MSAVLGVDASLTCTGLAVLAGSGKLYTHRVTSKGTRDASANDTAIRIERLRRQIAEVCFRGEVELLVIESPSFGSTGGKAHERGGLWWAVAADAAARGIGIAEVAPKTRAIYAVGHGKGVGKPGKDEVKHAVQARYGHLAPIPDDNVADAVVLAMMGARWLGRPVEDDLPDTHIRAMASVRWPGHLPQVA